MLKTQIDCAKVCLKKPYAIFIFKLFCVRFLIYDLIYNLQISVSFVLFIYSIILSTAWVRALIFYSQIADSRSVGDREMLCMNQILLLLLCFRCVILFHPAQRDTFAF